MPIERKTLVNYQISLFLKIEHRLITENKPLVIFLEAGHFNSRLGITNFSVNSFQGAIDIATNLIIEFKKKIRIILGVLIDNLGLGCDNNNCCIKLGHHGPDVSHKLPDEIEDILYRSPIAKRDRFVISSERNARNRGISTLKKMARSLKSNPKNTMLALEETGDVKKLYYKSEDRHNILLAEVIGNNWIVKCPTIMAQHYADLFQMMAQRFTLRYPRMVIDISEMLDRNKVNCGAEAALRQFVKKQLNRSRQEILNVCLGDKNGTIYTIDYFDSEYYQDCLGV